MNQYASQDRLTQQMKAAQELLEDFASCLRTEYDIWPVTNKFHEVMDLTQGEIDVKSLLNTVLGSAGTVVEINGTAIRRYGFDQ